MPLQSCRAPEGSSSLKLPYFKKLAHEVVKGVKPTHRPPLPTGNISGTHFFYRLIHPPAIVQPEELCQ
jgi:hypothetical protein